MKRIIKSTLLLLITISLLSISTQAMTSFSFKIVAGGVPTASSIVKKTDNGLASVNIKELIHYDRATDTKF